MYDIIYDFLKSTFPLMRIKNDNDWCYINNGIAGVYIIEKPEGDGYYSINDDFHRHTFLFSDPSFFDNIVKYISKELIYDGS